MHCVIDRFLDFELVHFYFFNYQIFTVTAVTWYGLSNQCVWGSLTVSNLQSNGLLLWFIRLHNSSYCTYKIFSSRIAYSETWRKLFYVLLVFFLSPYPIRIVGIWLMPFIADDNSWLFVCKLSQRFVIRKIETRAWKKHSNQIKDQKHWLWRERYWFSNFRMKVCLNRRIQIKM